MMPGRLLFLTSILLPIAALAQAAPPGGDAADLAQKLSNPVASLISVPFQFNYDQGLGPGQDGHRLSMNLQPVVPVPISDDWNMISRTILPVERQVGVSARGDDEFGLGDITQSLFFSPKGPTAGGTIWGVGPAFLVPTATDDKLGAKKWGVGPTIVVLRQAHGVTYGFLANQIWSFATVGGYHERPPVSSLFLQPFVSYTTPTAWTYGVNLESSYNWHAREASVPLNLTVGKLTKAAGMPISFTGGVRYWLHGADAGPHGWGFRAVITLLFPE
jgi:hypothetical protein